MPSDTSQILRKIIKEELKPIHEELKPIREALDQHTKILDQHTKQLGRLEDRVDATAGDVEQLLMDVKGLKDGVGFWHDRDKREIDEIKTHLGLPLMPDTPEV